MEDKQLLMKLIAINEKRFVLAEDVFTLQSFDVDQLIINLAHRIECDVDQNILLFDFKIRYLLGDAQLMEIENQFVLDIVDLKLHVLFEGELIKLPRVLMMSVLNIAVGTTRGILFLKLKETALKGFVFPILDLDQIIPDITNS